MAKITFYPNGNADCCKIDLPNGRSLLADYANRHDPEDDEDKRIDLEARIREELEEADRFASRLETFCFTRKKKTLLSKIFVSEIPPYDQ